jgi:hypothetical protein
MSTPRKFFKLTGILAIGFLLFAANLALLWNYSGIRRKVKIESGAASPIFQVAVIDSGKAELILSEKELEEYRKTHSNYSFLIPVDQKDLVQQQILASYKEKYGKNGGKGYPVLKTKSLDASHQLVELSMHGDPHDDVFWYEASEKQIRPQHYLVFSAFHLLLMVGIAVGLVAVEFLIGNHLIRLIRKRRVTQFRNAPI